MFNSQNLGALIVDKEPFVRSFDEPGYDIQNLCIEERYGFGVLNEGQAIAVAKNVKLRPNEVVLPAKTFFDMQAAITAGTFEAVTGLVGASPIDVNDPARDSKTV